MVSVTRENIKDLLPEIEANITNAFFVAIDTEFSGLNLGLEITRESRFDTAEQRYHRIRQNVRRASLLQFGLACFLPVHTDISDDNEEYEDLIYKTVCYNIILAPADIGLLEFQPKILTAEWGSMRFLRSHDFDFNNVIDVGVPYVKAKDIVKFAARIARGTESLQDSDIDPDALRQSEAEVQQLQKSIDDDAGKSTEYIFKELKTSPYILHCLLREIQPDIWTVPLTWNSLKAEIVGPAKRAELEQKDRILEEWVIRESTMAGRIFARLIRERKVIVGFQLLSDILFLIEAFYADLPENYTDFKVLIQDLFPNLYDGKVISHLLSRQERINNFGHFDSPALLELYTTLTTTKSTGMFSHAPQFHQDIRHTFYAFEAHAHEAAYDSFMSGVVFLYSLFAIEADKVAESRSRTIQAPPGRRQYDTGPIVDSAGPKRPMRDGSSTCHALPPLILRQIQLDLNSVFEYRGILYVHLSADQHLNIFGNDEQSNRSKAWVRLTSRNGHLSPEQSVLVKGYLSALVYEHQVKSSGEIVIACTTPDRAVKVAEYARRTLGVNAEIFDSAEIKEVLVVKSLSGYRKVVCGVLLTSLLGFACQSLFRTK